jgi:hypothetical protein
MTTTIPLVESEFEEIIALFLFDEIWRSFDVPIES